VTLTGQSAGEGQRLPGWMARALGGARAGLANRRVDGRREAVLTCAVKGGRFKLIAVLV